MKTYKLKSIKYYYAMVRRNAKVELKKIYNMKKSGKVIEGMDGKQQLWDKRQTYVNECDRKIFEFNEVKEESQAQINAILEKVSKKYAAGTAKGKIRKLKIMKKFQIQPPTSQRKLLCLIKMKFGRRKQYSEQMEKATSCLKSPYIADAERTKKYSYVLIKY